MHIDPAVLRILLKSQFQWYFMAVSPRPQLAVSAEHQPTLTFSCQWNSPLTPKPALHNRPNGPYTNTPAWPPGHYFGSAAENSETQCMPSACGSFKVG